MSDTRMSQQERRNWGQVEAANPATSVQRLEVLSANLTLRSIVAGNPATPASLLERMAQDQDEQVREQVASNPNTPWPILKQLAWEFPHAFLHNPVGPLQMLAHPEQINTDELFWDQLLRTDSLPSLWWDWLRSHPVLSAKQTLRLHVQFSGETSNFYGIPREGEEQELLLLVELLSAACAQGMSFPPFTDHSVPDQAAVPCEQIVEEHFWWLARHARSEVRQAVAGIPRAPGEVLRLLSRDRTVKVQAAVAENPQTPVETLGTLAHHRSAVVRFMVSINPQTPAEALRVLARDQEYGRRKNIGTSVRTALARNPQTPPEILHQLAQDPDRSVQYAVAGNSSAPTEALLILSQHQDFMLREVVAENPQTPVEILQILVRDPRWEVMAKAIGNAQMSPEILRTLAGDESSVVRFEVARHPHVSVEILQQLAQDKDILVRRQAAGHPRMPIETLRTLAMNIFGDTDADWIPEAVAGNPQAPPEELSMLARDEENAAVRLAVAKHAQTPTEVLHLLAQDINIGVQVLANRILDLLPLFDESMHERPWREELDGFVANVYGNHLTPQGPIVHQLRHLAELDMPDRGLQMILVTLVADWDAALIQHAFSESTMQEKCQHILSPIMPPLALQKLAASPLWEVRYLVALCEQTPRETLQRLSQDGNRYVRAMAKARMGYAIPSSQTTSL